MEFLKILGTEIDSLTPVPYINGNEKFIIGRKRYVLCFFFPIA